MTNIFTNRSASTVSNLQTWRAEFAAQQQANLVKEKTVVGDLVEPFSGKKIRDLLKFGTSPKGYNDVTIGNPDARKSLGYDYGWPDVNAISDLLFLGVYGWQYEGIDIGDHTKFFDKSNPHVARIRHMSKGNGEYIAFDWHGYQWVPSNDKMDENHVKNMNELHLELDTIYGALASGHTFYTVFAGSNSQRCAHRLIETMEMTVEQARALKRDDFNLSRAAKDLNEKVVEATGKIVGAGPVLLDSVDLTAIAFPFAVSVELPNVKPFNRVVNSVEDLWYVQGVMDLAAKGEAKVTLVK